MSVDEKTYSIYKLFGNCKEVYFGSTKNPLARRLAVHRSESKRWLKGLRKHRPSAYDICRANPRIQLLATAVDKGTATRIEQLFIDNNKDIAVNKNSAISPTLADIKEYQRLYRHNHRARLRERQNTRLLCDCGLTYTRQNKQQHMRSKKHNRRISTTA